MAPATLFVLFACITPVVLVIGIPLCGYPLANYITNEFGITTSRLIIKHGWLRR